MNLELNDRVALVAGSSKGIGKAIATALLREGCRVCITGRSADELEKAHFELDSEFHGNVFSVAGDLTDAVVIRDVMGSIVNRWKKIDILVANIGTGAGKPGWQNDEAEWQRLFNLNFFGSVRLAQSFIPMLSSTGGNILFMGSIVALEASAAPLPYSAAKAAIANYSKNLARALAHENVRVNCLCPGNILFPGGSWDRHLASRHDEVLSYISDEVPQKRFGTLEEIASFAAYLLSPISGFATGGTYVMDGGQTHRY